MHHNIFLLKLPLPLSFYLNLFHVSLFLWLVNVFLPHFLFLFHFFRDMKSLYNIQSEDDDFLVGFYYLFETLRPKWKFFVCGSFSRFLLSLEVTLVFEWIRIFISFAHLWLNHSSINKIHFTIFIFINRWVD